MARIRALTAAAVLLVSCGSDDAEPKDPESTEMLVPAPACAAASRSDAVDLLRIARLSAVGTTTTLSLWTREDKDEPSTLRDDVAENGWLPSGDGEAIARIDLGPAGGPFALRSLDMTWDVAPGSVEVRVRDACGGGLVARAKATPGAPVALGDVCGACVEIVVRDAGDARLLAAKLESASSDPRAVPIAPPVATATITHPDLGVVEGFYGQPWTWDERARIVDTLAASGLGLYVYAPKDDPLHRAKWRTPYDASFVERFGVLAKAARARGVKAVIAVSPFIDFDPASGDRDLLVTKLRAFVEAGADGIALFADDIEFETDRPVDAALGALHAEVTNEVVSALRATRPELTAFFVGTVYSDARRKKWPTADVYLDALKGLDPSVRVFWTGADTFSPTLSAAGVASVTAAIGRAPALWDNYWPTDAGDAFFGRVLLAPLRDRDGDLLGATSAFLQNPSIPGATARLQTALLGAWASAPSADADAHRATAAAFEARNAAYAGDEVARAALVKRAMELFDGSGLADDFPRHRALDAALARIDAALAANAPVAGDDVRSVLSLLASARAAGSEVHHSTLAVDLVDELGAPLAKVARASDVLLLALDRIAEAQSGGDVDAIGERLANADAELEPISRFRWLDDRVHAFVKRAFAVPRASSTTPRPRASAAFPACVVGRELVMTPFADAAAIEAHGLAGAVVDGTKVRWTPPHPGTFEVVLVAAPDPTRPWSFATRTESIVCRPAG